MVAVDCKQYKERPQIKKLVRVTPASVTIHWLIGTYSGVWREWKKQGNNISKEVDPENIVLPGIALTKSNRLHPSTVAQLKRAYSNIHVVL